MLLEVPNIVSNILLVGFGGSTKFEPCFKLTPDTEVGRPELITLKDKTISEHGTLLREIFKVLWWYLYQIVTQKKVRTCGVTPKT